MFVAKAVLPIDGLPAMIRRSKIVDHQEPYQDLLKPLDSPETLPSL